LTITSEKIIARYQPRTQALWFVYVIKRTWDGTRGRKMENEIDQINPRGPRKGRASPEPHSAWVRGWPGILISSVKISSDSHVSVKLTISIMFNNKLKFVNFVPQ
jgi:hypothetical protein